MATELTTFHKVLRAILGDRDADIHIYDGDQLDAGMIAAVNLGKVPGYTISEDESSIEPTLSTATTVGQKAYARLIYHTAKMFVVTLTSNSFRTRAFSESFGDSKEFIFDIVQEVHQLENGDGASD